MFHKHIGTSGHAIIVTIGDCPPGAASASPCQSSMFRAPLFDCEDRFLAGGWLVSPGDRVGLMAEGQSGKEEDGELDGRILTQGEVR